MRRRQIWSTARAEEVRRIVLVSRETVGLAGIVGLVTGLAVALFDWLTVDQGLRLTLALPVSLRPWAPLVGLAIAAILLRLGGRLSPSTSDEYIAAFHSHDDMPTRPVPWKVVAAVVTLGSGSPGGLEGPSMYLGSAIGTRFQQGFRRLLGSSNAKALMVAGAAAGVAAIFKAPATGAVFALEVPYRDDLGRRLLMPALVGASTGYLAFVSVSDTSPLLRVGGRAPFDVRDLVGAAALGVLTAVVIRGYAFALRTAKRVHRRRPEWLTVAAGGALVALAAICAHAATGRSIGLGPGYRAITWATDPRLGLPVIALILAVRLVGTVATVGAGGTVGLFIPLVVAGALLGRLAGGVLAVENLNLFVVIGIAAALGAGYRVPLASVMFVAEVTGRPGYVVPGLLAAVGADLVMGDAAVTSYQQSGSAVVEEH